MGPNCFPVGISWVQKFFSRVFRDSQFFSRGYFLGQRFFLVGISEVKDFFSWVFLRSKIFSRGYLVGPDFFSRDYFVAPSFFLVRSKFYLVGRKKSGQRCMYETGYSCSNRL